MHGGVRKWGADVGGPDLRPSTIEKGYLYALGFKHAEHEMPRNA